MRGETKERWRELCERAVVEQDPNKFVATIQELLQVLEDRERQRKAPEAPIPHDKNESNLSCPLAGSSASWN
jgi:hypothetical protein